MCPRLDDGGDCGSTVACPLEGGGTAQGRESDRERGLSVSPVRPSRASPSSDQPRHTLAAVPRPWRRKQQLERSDDAPLFDVPATEEQG